MILKKLFPALLAFSCLGKAAEPLRPGLEIFLENHCYDCHDDIDKKGGLDLMSLDFDPSDTANFATWARVFEKVHSGQMPPKKKDRPPENELSEFLKTVENPLRVADLERLHTTGRVASRRLTAEEYEYTIHDLLHVEVPLAKHLTGDPDKGFENAASGQQVSLFLIDAYLNTADLALEEAFARAAEGDESFDTLYDQETLVLDSKKNGYRGPERHGDELIMRKNDFRIHGQIRPAVIPAAGWYDITVHDAKGGNIGKDGAVWCTLEAGNFGEDAHLRSMVGLIEATGKAKNFTFRSWIGGKKILFLQPGEGRIFDRATHGKDLTMTEEFLSFTGISVNRVFPYGSADEIRQAIFPGLTPAEMNSIPENPGERLTELVGKFANRAFRRPVPPEVIAGYAAIALDAFKSGAPFATALRNSYHAVLCSPYFLTFVEEPGKLNDHAIASRLSYMLWKSMPDEELRSLADEGKLSDPAVRTAQIDRMLTDPRSERFIRSFTNQWLELRNMDATQPDLGRFGFFDAILQQTMADETRAFVRELIDSNLGVSNFLKSDFAMLNTRLKTHYGMDEAPVIPGGGIQKVAVPSGGRSGLVTQGSILKITADGSVTSPVLRGVFVNERLLGIHLDPPPPGITAIEPDVRGAVSIRDQLEKHRSSISCAGCHAKIDPPGFALEAFDPVGQMREWYGRPKKSALIDTSGTTFHGDDFLNLFDYRDAALKSKENMARGFVAQLVRYGTGGEIRFSDREVLDEIVEKTRPGNFGLRDLLYATVNSRLFLEK